MITDGDAIELAERLEWKSKSMKTEYFTGRFYSDPATVQYKKIMHMESTKEYMSELIVNKDEDPGFIRLLGYKAVRLEDGDFLIKVFEPFRLTVEGATEEMRLQGQRWREETLLETLENACGACELLARKNNNHFRITPQHMLVTESGKVKLPHVKARSSHQKAGLFAAPESNSTYKRTEAGLSDVYALGAVLAYMFFMEVPKAVEDGRRKWSDMVAEVAVEYRVLGSILPKMLEENPEKRYNFRHLVYALKGVPWESLTSLNGLIANNGVRACLEEAVSHLDSLSSVLPILSARPISFLTCPSCLRIVEDSGQDGFLCICGAIYIK